MGKTLAMKRGLDDFEVMRPVRFLPVLMATAVLGGWPGVSGAGDMAVAAEADTCWATREALAAAVTANTQSFGGLRWTPFDRAEQGWEAYQPLIAEELGTVCPPGSPGFAEALAAFQGRYALEPSGAFTVETFQVFRGLWQERRPFLMARTRGECPDPPAYGDLGYIMIKEEQADRLFRTARRDVLAAYRRMAAAARAEVPEIAANPELLQIFSGYRAPDDDALRCAEEGNCDGLRRATCSAHRTGAALDIYVGHAADYGVDSTHPYNRLHQSRGAAYRWLVRNARRFGFTPYVYEPWHWEWIGPPADSGEDD